MDGELCILTITLISLRIKTQVLVDWIGLAWHDIFSAILFAVIWNIRIGVKNTWNGQNSNISPPIADKCSSQSKQVCNRESKLTDSVNGWVRPQEMEWVNWKGEKFTLLCWRVDWMLSGAPLLVSSRSLPAPSISRLFWGTRLSRPWLAGPAWSPSRGIVSYEPCPIHVTFWPTSQSSPSPVFWLGARPPQMHAWP